MELSKVVIPADSPDQVTLLIGRGRVALANEAYDEARRDLDGAIRAGKSIFFQMTALVARAELNLYQGRLTEAEADARRSLTLARQSQNGMPYSNRTGMALLMLGRVLQKKDDASGSQQALRAAIDNLSNTVDSDHPMLLLARQLVRD
jgi:tetratricopeptide (TPR) repeat protein